MSDDILQQIIDLYDEYIRDAGREVKIAEAREAIKAEVISLLVDSPRNLDAEADRLIQATITSTRSKRSRSLREQLDYILDGFTEDGIYVDPLLDQAYGLGDEHGIDKTLRFWRIEDFANLVVTRYRVAAEATKAASDIDTTAQRCIDRMREAGAVTFGDLSRPAS